MKNMKKTFLLVLFMLVASVAGAQEDYQFVGRHFIASYYGCDTTALCDVKKLNEILEMAANASGAHVLKSADFLFPPHGLTAVLLLSESHASIHTYPEFGACFIDLFTCGHSCSAEKFDQVLRAYLKPAKVNAEILERK